MKYDDLFDDFYDIEDDNNYSTHWKTNDGEQIAYKDLTTSHIRNILNSLDRIRCLTDSDRQLAKTRLIQELTRRNKGL